MRAREDVVAELEQLMLRNKEIAETVANVEVLWALEVGNPLFSERERNLWRIVALEWVLEIEH